MQAMAAGRRKVDKSRGKANAISGKPAGKSATTTQIIWNICRQEELLKDEDYITLDVTLRGQQNAGK